MKRTTPHAYAFAQTRAEALYPAWLLPEPLRLQAAGNSPVYQGKLTRLAGPQRLEAAEWLLADRDNRSAEPGLCEKPWAFRDYYIYRSQQGGLLWVYSERLGSAAQAGRQRTWYLHGFFA